MYITKDVIVKYGKLQEDEDEEEEANTNITMVDEDNIQLPGGVGSLLFEEEEAKGENCVAEQAPALGKRPAPEGQEHQQEFQAMDAGATKH